MQAITKTVTTLAIMTLMCAAQLGAQQADVIRGRVVDQTGRPIESARITVTSIPGNVARNTTSDKNGRYTVVFASADGDYWISVTALGLTQKRFELKRIGDEAVLIGDATLVRAAVLDAVKVQADRARVSRNAGTLDVSGTEKTIGSAAVDPGQAGNLAAVAASVPGVQLIPGVDGAADQFSVFGLSGDQNRTTLNGIGFSGNDIPRDATTRMSLSTSPWDVSRGGFSGGMMGLSTQAGSNFSTRGVSSLITTPSAQWIDRAGRSLGASYTSLSLGAATSGPASNDKSFYSIGYQFDRRTSALPTLNNADAVALKQAGIAVDSVARLEQILATTGIPVATSRRAPDSRETDRALVLANFDWAPPTSTSGQAFTVTAVGSYVGSNAPFAQVTALPTSLASSRNWIGVLQARQTFYLPSGVLSESSLGVNQQRTATAPYLETPTASVRVTSTLDDTTSAIAGLTLGGGPMQRTSSTTTAASLRNQLSWFSLDSRHRVQLTSSLRVDGFRQDLTTNALGTFTYNSLGDLENGKPATFSRTLSTRIRSGKQMVGSVALGDAFRVRPDFQVQYGLRIDGNRFLDTPARNSQLESALGVRNDVVPGKLYASPRVGFSWTYGEAAQLAAGEGFTRGPRAVLRGGVGMFQNTPDAQVIASALSNTGLQGSTVQLTCVGAATPIPAWNSYTTSPASIPTQCADGSDGSAFASRAPDVILFESSYAAQRSWRGNVNWMGAVIGNRFVASVDGTYSLNVNQPGVRNVNFNPVARFSLADESNRPVYVQPTSIVASTGAVSSIDSRIAPQFGPVMQLRSNLQSINRQLSVSLQPIAFSSQFSWSVAYVYSNTRDILSGFVSTVGDPRTEGWARAQRDSRHQLSYSVSYNFFNMVPVGLTGSFRSGLPFTPLTSADVNGDGLRNDRAFVFATDGASDPTISSSMTKLLAASTPAVRSCLNSQLGKLAARNSCQEPWTTTSNLSIGLNSVRLGLPQRLNVSFSVNNVVGAADLLINGESRRKGWGQALQTDQTLLYVRGFDPTARRFRYDVNPRFGTSNPQATINRNPVVVTAQLRYDVGFARERQLLTQSLDRGRARNGERASGQDIRGMSATLIPQNPIALILRQADTLKLSRVQLDSLASLNRRYALVYDSLWTPVATYLSALPVNYNRKAAYARYRGAREKTIDQLMVLAPLVRELLTADQLRLLPGNATTSLDRRYLAGVRSSTAGGANLGALGMLAQMGWAGGTVDASASAVMIHR